MSKFLTFIFFIVIMASHQSMAQIPSDVKLQVGSSAIKKVIDGVIKGLSDETGLLRKDVIVKPLTIKDIEFKKMGDAVKFYGRNLLNLNFDGKNTIKVKIDGLKFQGGIKIGEMSFKYPVKSGKLDVSFPIEITNFYSKLRKIQIIEQNFTEPVDVDDSYCPQEYKDRHQGHLWMKAYNISLGHKSALSRVKNRIKINVRAILDLNNKKQPLKIKKLTNNIKDNNLPLGLYAKNIILPEVQIVTKSKEDVIRCSPLNFSKLKEDIEDQRNKIRDLLISKVSDFLSKDSIKKINNKIKELNWSIPTGWSETVSSRPLPLDRKTNDLVVNDLQNNIQTVRVDNTYVHVYSSAQYLPAPRAFSVKEGHTPLLLPLLQKVYEDITSYRFNVELDYLNTTSKKTLEVGATTDLIVNGKSFRTDYVTERSESSFKFSKDKSDLAIAINSKFIGTLIDLSYEGLLKAKIPQGIELLDDTLKFKMSDNGYFTIAAKARIDLWKMKNIFAKAGDVVEEINSLLTGGGTKGIIEAPMQFKLKIKLFEKDGNKWIGLDMLTPSQNDPFDNDFGYENNVWKATRLIRWQAKKQLNKQIDKIKEKELELNISPYISKFGVDPKKIAFDGSGHLAIYVDLLDVSQFFKKKDLKK